MGNRGYAHAITDAIQTLHQRLEQRVDPAHLLAADTFLRATFPTGATRDHVARLVRPARPRRVESLPGAQS